MFYLVRLFCDRKLIFTIIGFGIFDNLHFIFLVLLFQKIFFLLFQKRKVYVVVN
jgi:hypothetical protein